jgi:hypothetical protein
VCCSSSDLPRSAADADDASVTTLGGAFISDASAAGDVGLGVQSPPADGAPPSPAVLSAELGDAGVVAFGNPIFSQASDGTPGGVVSGTRDGMDLAIEFPFPPVAGTYGCDGESGVGAAITYGRPAPGGGLQGEFAAPMMGNSQASCAIVVGADSTENYVKGTFSGRVYSADGGDFVDVSDGVFSMPLTLFLTP